MIGCAGILVRDTFCGPARAIPEEGGLVIVDAMPVKAGGCAANVAINLGKQRLPVELFGCLGKDAAGEAMQRILRDHGIDCGRLVFTDRFPTSETVILLIEGQDRRYFHSFGANRAFTVSQIDRNWVAGLGIFYLGGLFALPSIDIAELAELFRFCVEKGVTTVLDVVAPEGISGGEELRRLLPHVDWILPNNTEAAQFTGETDPALAAGILRRWGAKNVVVTLGKAGAVAASGDDFWRCGAYSWKAKDPSGSGDAFASGILTGIACGWDMPRTLRFASVLGASATLAIGTTDGVFAFEDAQRAVDRDPVAVERISAGFSGSR